MTDEADGRRVMVYTNTRYKLLFGPHYETGFCNNFPKCQPASEAEAAAFRDKMKEGENGKV